MTNLFVTITPDPNDGTKAIVSGEFSGGDSSYSYAKRIRVSVTGAGEYYFTSPQTSGGYNTFSGVITGLTPGTFYSWFAWLQVMRPGGFGGDSFEQNGNFTTANTTPQPPIQTYYAQLAFDANGGTGAPAAQSGSKQNVNPYVDFVIPYTTPTRPGYVFGGWTLNGTTGTIYPAGATISVYGYNYSPGPTHTLYAVWTEDTSGSVWLSPSGIGYNRGIVWLYDNYWRKGIPWICTGGTTWKRGV